MRPMPPEEMKLDYDNDSLESMVDPSGAVEGGHMNSDLCDVHANPGASHGTTFLPHSILSTLSAALRYMSQGLGSPAWSPPSPVITPSVPLVTCRPSIWCLPAHAQIANFDYTDDGARSDAKAITFVAGGDAEVDDSTAQTTRTAASNTSPRATAHQQTTSVWHAILPVLPIPPSRTTLEPRPREHRHWY